MMVSTRLMRSPNAAHPFDRRAGCLTRCAGFPMSNLAHGRRIAINLLAGPPVGCMTIVALIFVHDLLTPENESLVGNGARPGILALLVLGYVVGAMPALINSLLTACLFGRVSHPFSRMLLSLVTGVFSSVTTIGWLTLGSNAAASIQALGLLAAGGAAASLVASAIVEQLPPLSNP